MPSSEDEVGAALADHDRGRVGVAAGDRRHDRGVADPQPLDAADLEVGADDRELVDAHPAGADAVVDRRGPVEDRVAQLLALEVRAGVDLLLDRAAERRAGHDLAHHLRALGEHLEVGGVGEVLEVDQRRRRRVGRREPQRAAAARVDQRRQHRERRCAGRRRAGSARPGWARRRTTAAGAAAGRVRRSPATSAGTRRASKTELARNVVPGRSTSLATPRAKNERRAPHLRLWRGTSARGTGGRAGCRRPAGPRRTSMPWSRRCWAWPMPESISSCAEPTKPAERMTSLPARMVRVGAVALL